MKKISIIDILIVVVIIGAVGFIGSKFVSSGAHKGVRETINYTVMISAAEAGRYDNIQVGDVVCINEEQDHDTAKVISVSKSVAKVSAINSVTGEHKIVENPSKEDIIIELETDVLSDAVGMKNGETAIKVGMEAFVRGTGYSGKGFIIKIAD